MRNNPKIMRKRIEKAIPERLNNREEEEDDDQGEKTKQGKGFYACYLLTSLCPRFKGHTYIGFTVNPRRRIRQHNGEIRSGAFRTKKRRPWEMVFCIYGFPTNVSALQFEWAWQHPTESLAVRQAAATFKSLSGVANKIKLAYTMLTLPAWQSLNITVNFFSTKYMKDSGACPSLPDHMKVQVCPVDELPCYRKCGESLFECEEAERGFDNKENYESTTRISGVVRETLIELRDQPIDEYPCCNIQDESLSVEGEDSNGEIDDQGYDEVSCTSGTVKETEATITCPLSPDNPHSVSETSYEKFGWFEEYEELQHLKNISADYSATLKIDNQQPFVFLRSPMRTGPSISTVFSIEETGNADASTFTKRRLSGLDMPNQKSISGKACEDRSSFNGCTVPHAIEVIDLLSPSPESRIMSSKKRRLLTVSPEIIDLT